MKRTFYSVLFVAVLAIFIIAGAATAEDTQTSVDHNPQAGGYIGTNDRTTWYGGYVKYKADIRKPDANIVPGVGFLGNYTQGSVKGSTYKYNEIVGGPLVGVKYFGDDSEGNPWMVEADGTFQFYKMKGKNSEGYKNSQTGTKLNVRVEAKKQTSEKWTVGFATEANIGLANKFHSTYSGDRASNRGYFEAGPYIVYRINDNWEYEAAISGFWQGWDRLWGIKIVPIEFIYKKWLRAGAGVSLSPFGLSSAYKGVKAADLTTIFGFVQADAGPLLVRPIKAESNSGRVAPLKTKRPGPETEAPPRVPKD